MLQVQDLNMVHMLLGSIFAYRQYVDGIHRDSGPMAH